MGEAKRRGSYEERKERSICARKHHKDIEKFFLTPLPKYEEMTVMTGMSNFYGQNKGER